MSLCIRSLVTMLIVCCSLTARAAELVLTPTELTLVDGRKVQGQLACELEDRLVLYSPNLGTLASFRNEFVASFTDKDKKVVKVSAPRNLTPMREMNRDAAECHSLSLQPAAVQSPCRRRRLGRE